MPLTYVAVDVDGTLTHSNVSFAFGRFLYRKGVISLFQAFMPALLYGLHRIGLLSIERLHKSIFKILFYRRASTVIEQAVDEFLASSSSFLIRERIKEELALLRKGGAHLALLSSSPDFLVKRVARILAIDEWHATEYVVDESGAFSSIRKVVTGSVKAQIATEVKKEQGALITAMTDSMCDLPLLEVADQVVAVFPDRKLELCARKRGWRIVNNG